ncbi:PAS domain S-box protein [Niastella caeni]|uniref:PAS domain S-box protein n=1 Tax=Niastella caeni TaxID=2569763 RepID=A0A4S8HY64_9BACT|nr:PAS domain S-box protein [Niastella caeni]THU38172.1 PAS domain S-box protein [Niastella caeni]
MGKHVIATNNPPGDVILVSIAKKTGIINAIWPMEARLHGVAGRKCIGKKILSFLTPESKAVFKSTLAKKSKPRDTRLSLEFSSKKLPPITYTCSVWHMRKQPLVLVIHNQPVPEAIAAEQPAPGTAFIERSIAEQLIREAEDKFRRIIDKITMPIAAYEIEPPKRFLFINPKFTEWFGYTIEDIPDIERWKQLAYRSEAYFLEKQREWRDEIKRIQNGEKRESHPFDITIYCKDGTPKDLEMSFTIDEDLCYITFNDVTEKNAVTRALQANEEKFRNISEQLPIPIFVFDAQGETRFLNNAFIETFGYTKEDIPTRLNWLNKAYPDVHVRNHVITDYEKETKRHPEKSRSVSQYDVRCKDGSVKIIEFFMSMGDKNVYIVANDISGKVKAEQELKQSHRQLRELSSHLENIREEERKHISREIHDELGQQLTLLKLDLLQMSKKLPPEEQEVKAQLEQADQLLAETMRSVRKIATQLRPSILDNLGLVSALEWQSREFEKNFGIRCIFESLLPEPQFTTNQSNALFRIYQEALTNVARHAGATQVDAVLSQEKNRIVLEIRDNGKGFRMENMTGKKTLGLKGMHERALMIDGDFRLESRPGEGTYIQVSTPIFITNQEITQL